MIKKKILFYTEPSFWKGGDQKYIRDLLNYLDKDKYQVYFAFPTCSPKDVPDFPEEINVIKVPLKGSIEIIEKIFYLFNFKKLFCLKDLYRLLLFELSIVSLRKIISSIKPDIVHISNGGWPGSDNCRAATVAASKAGVKAVLFSWHNLVNIPGGLNVLWDKIITYRCLKSVDVFLTFSKNVRQDFLENLKVNLKYHKKFSYIYHGIPVSNKISKTTSAPNKPIKVFFCAFFEPRKGPEIVIRCVRILKNYNFEFHLYGEGSLLENCKDLSKDLKNIYFHGYEDNVALRLHEADILLQPSQFGECFPYIIIEAMRSGLAIVSSDVAGIPEQVIHNVNGFVCETADKDSYIKSLEILAKNPGKLCSMKIASRKRFENLFTIEKMIKNTSELYEKMCRGE